MPRQTAEDEKGAGLLYACDACGKKEVRPGPGRTFGNPDDGARVAGWIIGPGGKPVWCPECTGRNEEYWINWGQLTDAKLAAYLAGGDR